jgi:hypothetical protein
MDPEIKSLLKAIRAAMLASDIAALDALVATHGRDVIVACCRAGRMLRVAASEGLVSVLQWLADLGAATLEDCRAQDSAPFVVAASEGHVGALDWFARHYAALGLTPEEAVTEYRAQRNFAVVLASYSGHVDVLRWLAARGVVTRDACQTHDWNSDVGEGALHVAACLPVLKLFADECYPAMGLTARDFVDDCLLHNGCIFRNAAGNGKIGILECLETRALAVGMSAEDFTARILPSHPLIYAIENGHTDVADWLAAHGVAGLDECITALDSDEISTTGLYWLANHGLSRINFDAAGYGDAWLKWMGQRLVAADRRESAAAGRCGAGPHF